MGFGDYNKIDFNTYMSQYMAPAYTVDNTNFVNKYTYARNDFNSIYSNPNRPKTAEQQTYDYYEAFLRKYGNTQYQTSQSNGSTKSESVITDYVQQKKQQDGNNEKIVNTSQKYQIQVGENEGDVVEVSIDDCDKAIEQIETEEKKLDESIQEDGSARITDDTPISEMNFGQKLKTVVVDGGLVGGFKFVESLLGIENGWKGFINGGWKKCLTNLASMGLAYVLMHVPVIGPILSTAFLWLTRGDALRHLYYAVKGLCKAKTAQDLQTAGEHIGIAITELVGGKNVSKKIRLKGGIKCEKVRGIKGLFKQFKNEFKATRNQIQNDKAKWNTIQQQSNKGTLGKLREFAKDKRAENKKFRTNEMDYNEKTDQITKQSENFEGKKGFFGRLFKKKTVKVRTGNADDNKVMTEIKNLENSLKTSRETRINSTTKADMDAAIANKGEIGTLRNKMADVLAGKDPNLQGLDNDAKNLFVQEMERLISSEKQFNKMYRRDFFRAKQKYMGSLALRGENKFDVITYTGGKTTRPGQIWAMNTKPAEMNTFKYLGLFGLKGWWNGQILSYTIGKPAVGTPYMAAPIVRNIFNPDEFEGEYKSSKEVTEMKEELKEDKEYYQGIKDYITENS